MNKQLKSDIILAWNEAEEMHSFLKETGRTELLDNRQSLINKSFKIMNLLDKYFTEEELAKFFK